MSVQTDPASPSSSSSSTTGLTFIQGFLFGQFTIACLIIFFIKYFIFGEPPPPDLRANTRASLRRQRTLSHQTLHLPQHQKDHQRTPSNTTLLRHKRSAILRPPPPPLTSATILAKTYYNVKGHQPESLDWFNVLVAQTIAQLRADARHDNAVLTSLTAVLNGPTRPDWLGEITVTEIELGDEFPIFSNCRVIPVDDAGNSTQRDGASGGSGGGVSEGGRLQARMDVDLSDVITLGIETTVQLNWPRKRVAVMPVALAVSIVRFSGTLSLSFIPSAQPAPASSNDDTKQSSPEQGNKQSSSPDPTSPPTHTPTTLAFTFLDDYRLDLSVRSLLGSRSRLQDVPKIAQIIESRIHDWFDERCVEPRFQQIILPSLWPRKKNTRGGEEETEEDEEEEDGQEDGSIEADTPGRGASDELERETAGPSPVPNGDAPSSLKQPRPQRQFMPPDSLEARMEVEGAKMREAEQRAQAAERAHAARDEVRYRGRPQANREQSEVGNRGIGRGDPWRSMPGSLPGVETLP